MATTPLITPDDLILKAVRDRTPLVLFLGQNAWFGLQTRDLLAQVSARLSLGDGPMSWLTLTENHSLPETFYEWLAERYSRRPAPAWLSNLAQIPWSAIYTSSMDGSIRDAFSTSSRDAQPILTAAEQPLASRSTARTPIYYLFSRAGVSTDPLATPPVDRATYRTRLNRHAIPMLNRISIITTAIGLLVIDGYSAGDDWLPLGALLAAIDDIPGGRILWCGYEPPRGVEDRQDVESLVAHGRIVVTPSRLATLVADVIASGKLADVLPADTESTGIVTLGSSEQRYAPPAATRLRTEAVAAIVDDSWTAFLPPLGKDAHYAGFLEFHSGGGSARASVNGIRYGFAISRHFEDNLWSVVQERYDDPERRDGPTIVHGQSGTGKSVALARLVINARARLHAPVLYAHGRVPQGPEVELFCREAEAAGAKTTVIVCDCNASADLYWDLHKSLRSRGRRFLIIGSTYRQRGFDEDGRLRRGFVEAPDELTSRETVSMTKLLTDTGFTVDAKQLSVERHVLPALYRFLPPSRPRLSAGLGLEARATVLEVRQRGQEQRPVHATTELGEKLIAAGLVDRYEHILLDAITAAKNEEGDAAERLIDLVMVAGRLGCPVPIDLLIRAVREEVASVNLTGVERLFRGLDLLRIRESGQEGEELCVSPRLTLEADLICRRRLAGPRDEGRLIANLISAARLSLDAGNTERRFVLDLVQRVKTDGASGDRYSESYLAIARALTELRLRYGVNDWSLMLQESVVRREAIKTKKLSESEVEPLLEEARTIIEEALDGLAEKGSRHAVRGRGFLLVERATIYGFLAEESARRGRSAEETWSAYEAALLAANAAAGISDAYIPLDVSLWLALDLQKIGGLSEMQTLELRSDIYTTLDRIDVKSLPASQRDLYDKRRLNVGEQFQDTELSESAFQALCARGSAAGYLLRARARGIQFSEMGDEAASNEQRRHASSAAKYLRENWEAVRNDGRCLRYLLQLEWVSATRYRPLRGERRPLPASEGERIRLLELIRAINDLDNAYVDPGLMYLEAVLSWLIGDERHAREMWKRLEQESVDVEYARVVRRNIVTDESGSPVFFSGRVERVSARRFDIMVEELDRSIKGMRDEFGGDTLTYGRSISGFGIAFNYIGPIVDVVGVNRRES